jgi:hypothetical protein
MGRDDRCNHHNFFLIDFRFLFTFSVRFDTRNAKRKQGRTEDHQLELWISVVEYGSMKNDEKNGVLRGLKTDVQAVADHLASGKPLNPEVIRRIRQESARIQEKIRRRQGLVDIAVPAIRELRDELPEP